MTEPKSITTLADDLAQIIWELGARGLDGVCCAGLSLVEHRTLQQLDRDAGCTVQSLGGQAALTKSGATRLVDRLEQRGMLRRERSDEDGRVCCVALTGDGRRELARANQAFAGRLAALLDGLSATERNAVATALPALSRQARRTAGTGCC